MHFTPVHAHRSSDSYSVDEYDDDFEADEGLNATGRSGRGAAASRATSRRTLHTERSEVVEEDRWVGIRLLLGRA